MQQVVHLNHRGLSKDLGTALTVRGRGLPEECAHTAQGTRGQGHTAPPALACVCSRDAAPPPHRPQRALSAPSRETFREKHTHRRKQRLFNQNPSWVFKQTAETELTQLCLPPLRLSASRVLSRPLLTPEQLVCRSAPRKAPSRLHRHLTELSESTRRHCREALKGQTVPPSFHTRLTVPWWEHLTKPPRS